MVKLACLLLILSCIPLFSFGQFAKVQNLVKEKKWFDASQELINLNDESLSIEDQGLKYFTLGVTAAELQNWKDSEFYFNLSLDKSPQLKTHSLYELAQIYLAQGDLQRAQANLDLIIKMGTARNIQNQALFMLSEVHMKKTNWRLAHKNILPLERRWRGEENHAEVLWRLVQIEIHRQKKWMACRWARKLYSHHPSHPIIHDWGIDLSKNKVNDKPLGCLTAESDVSERIRRWNWAGDPERAQKELNDLRKNIKNEALYEVDKLMAQHLVQQGFATESVQLLLPYFEKKNKDFNYLMSLALAAARSGEHLTAIGAYTRAHNLDPKSKNGRIALFRSAFLSYQFQDYDGASRKFQKFIEIYSKSGLTRDAQWHLAWLRYLKGDYHGAIAEFGEILKQKKLHKKKWASFPEERIRYWLAMSYYKLEDFPKAQALLHELSQDRLIGFYSLTAKARLSEIPKPLEVTIATQSLEPSRLPAAQSLDQEYPAQQADAEENESEETLSEETEVSLIAEEESEISPEKEEPVVEFKDPKFREYFRRGQDFVRVGLLERARWEYYEVERKTSNKDYLALLMKAYEETDSHHRSAAIGQIFFITPRQRYEMQNIKYLWEHTYPRAYKQQVEKYATEFDVPTSFIWGIMRAESLYRPFVVSPVGAQGLMQIMPNTGLHLARLLGMASFQKSQLKEPEVNIRLGSRYLQRLTKMFKGSHPLAAAAYNAGPHRVESWLASFGNLELDEFIEHIPFVETRNYVKKVVRYQSIYNRLYNNRSEPELSLAKSLPVVIEGKPSMRESWEQL